jgi:hypothetical protein
MHESARQDFVVEVWIEKSTQNDWLVPLCRKRGVNLVVGIGESSEIRSRELAERSAKYAVPTRIIYISDFDPGGRSMPKAVARKVEFTLRKFDLDCDLQLIPLALTPEQCRQYKLPRTPIKETEQRKDKFEETFGAGATELDALEALYPGELARLLTAELDNFLDATLEGRLQSLKREMQGGLRAIEDEIHAEHSEEIDEIAEAIDELAEQLSSLKERASELWKTIARELWEKSPRCRTDEVEFPRSEAPGETESFVLFDSKRSYLEQMDFYNAWKAGDE